MLRSRARFASALILVGCLAVGLSACGDASGDAGSSTAGAGAEDRPQSPSERCKDTGVESSAMWLPVGESRFDVGVAGSGTTTAIFTHQNNQDACGFWPYASTLVDDGVQVLLVNLCGYGETDCAAGADVVDSGADAILAAADWARDSGAERVVSVGASMGGATAIAAGARDGADGRLDAVADLAGPISFAGFDTLAVASTLEVPLLLAVSPRDTVVRVEKLRELADATASTDVTIINEGAGHGWSLLQEGGVGDFTEFADTLTAFITG